MLLHWLIGAGVLIICALVIAILCYAFLGLQKLWKWLITKMKLSLGQDFSSRSYDYHTIVGASILTIWIILVPLFIGLLINFMRSTSSGG